MWLGQAKIERSTGRSVHYDFVGKMGVRGDDVRAVGSPAEGGQIIAPTLTFELSQLTPNRPCDRVDPNEILQIDS